MVLVGKSGTKTRRQKQEKEDLAVQEPSQIHRNKEGSERHRDSGEGLGDAIEPAAFALYKNFET